MDRLGVCVVGIVCVGVGLFAGIGIGYSTAPTYPELEAENKRLFIQRNKLAKEKAIQNLARAIRGPKKPKRETLTTESIGEVPRKKGSSKRGARLAWSRVETWDFMGSKNTVPFTIRGSRWRISWRSGENGVTGLVYKIPGSEMVGNFSGIADSTEMYCGSGRYYLTLVTVEHARVWVEEYVKAGPSPLPAAASDAPEEEPTLPH